MQHINKVIKCKNLFSINKFQTVTELKHMIAYLNRNSIIKRSNLLDINSFLLTLNNNE